MMLIFTFCKNVDFKPAHVSLNIDESKNRNIFLCEYLIDSKSLPDTINFNYNEIWLEKQWYSYLDEKGQEKTSVVDSRVQLVINFKNLHLFEDNVYWDQFTLKDDKRNTMGSERGVLSLSSDELKKEPTNFKIFIIKVNDKYKPNLDSIKIGELIMKRK